MADIIQVKDSDFNPELFGSVFSKNEGVELTTEGIIEGFDNLIKTLDADFFEEMKVPPYYIKGNVHG
ncbi:MAG: hypothetical protein HW421_1283 [Ignavibacteria bacterium]|nr:hypothetical protein [Ignavibacteria bacterium]